MTTSLTRIIIFSFLFLLFMPQLTSAETKTFIKEYTYQASEDDSRNSSRVTAMREVKRLLLEELGIYLESITEVKNFQLTRDQITSLTAGIVKTEIVNEKWDGHTYWIRTKIAANTGEVIKSIDILRNDRVKSKELEEIRKRSDDILEENKKLREELKLAKGEAKQEVKDKYDKLIKKLSAIFWFESGIINYGKGAYDAAFDDFDKAIELDRNFGNAYAHRGITYSILGKNDEAILDYDKAIELNPKNVEVIYLRGLTYRTLGKYNEAILDYSKTIELNLNKVEAYYHRGSAYLFLKNYDGAILDYNKAIELDQKYVNAYIYRGVTYSKLNKYNQEILDYDKALELNPKEVEVYNYRGTASAALKNYDRAILDYNKAIELNPKYVNAYFNRGLTYYSLNKNNEAILDYSKVIELYPKSVMAYYLRACSHSILGHKVNAIQDLTKAIQMNPEFRNNAKNAAAFDNVKNNPDFKKLIGN